jgi:hypothetical protein
MVDVEGQRRIELTQRVVGKLRKMDDRVENRQLLRHQLAGVLPLHHPSWRGVQLIRGVKADVEAGHLETPPAQPLYQPGSYIAVRARY